MKHCRIEVSTGFLVFLCAYYVLDPAGSFFPFFTAAAAHELGHLLILLFLHIPIFGIRLGPFGTVIRTPTLPYFRELLVCLGGPAVNLVLLSLFARTQPLFAFTNLCLFAYNILPIRPLDGGRILSALLHMLLPEKLACLAAQAIAIVSLCTLLCICVYLSCVWHAGLWPILLSASLLLRLGADIR